MIKEWFKTKLRKFIGVDTLEENLNIYKKSNERHHSHFYGKLKNNEDAIKSLHSTLENVVHIGTDVTRDNNYGRSWSVVCIEGKINIVKFVDLNGRDAREILNYLKQFEAGRHCIDTPAKEFFYNELYKF